MSITVTVSHQQQQQQLLQQNMVQSSTATLPAQDGTRIARVGKSATSQAANAPSKRRGLRSPSDITAESSFDDDDNDDDEQEGDRPLQASGTSIEPEPPVIRLADMSAVRELRSSLVDARKKQARETPPRTVETNIENASTSVTFL